MRGIRSTGQLELLLTSDWWICRWYLRLFLFILIHSYVLVLVLAHTFLLRHTWNLNSILVHLFGHIVQILHVSLLRCQASRYYRKVRIGAPHVCTVLFALSFTILIILLVRQRVLVGANLLHLGLTITQVHGRHVGLHHLLGIVIRIDLFQILPFVNTTTVQSSFGFTSEIILLSSLLVRHVLLDHCIVVLRILSIPLCVVGTVGVKLTIRRHH